MLAVDQGIWVLFLVGEIDDGFCRGGCIQLELEQVAGNTARGNVVRFSVQIELAGQRVDPVITLHTSCNHNNCRCRQILDPLLDQRHAPDVDETNAVRGQPSFSILRSVPLALLRPPAESKFLGASEGVPLTVSTTI